MNIYMCSTSQKADIEYYLQQIFVLRKGITSSRAVTFCFYNDKFSYGIAITKSELTVHIVPTSISQKAFYKNTLAENPETPTPTVPTITIIRVDPLVIAELHLLACT